MVCHSLHFEIIKSKTVTDEDVCIHLHQLGQFSERLAWTICLLQISRPPHDKLLDFICELLKRFHLLFQLLQLGNFAFVLVAGVGKALAECVHLRPQQSRGSGIRRLHKLLHFSLHG